MVGLEAELNFGNVNGTTTNRGFYVAVNPNGLKPNTNLLVLRLGFHF